MVFAGGSMKHFDYESVKEEEVPAPAKGVKVRWLIDEKIGAPNFAMRRFTVEPGGYTPCHSHPWEHEVFILSGTGVVLGEGGKEPVKPGDVVFMPSDEKHQFRNTGDRELAFLCLIPLQK
jgi:quercetin dioxygenase-like cupin family protein